ncbi:MAG: PadR family transcriptional regulator [Longimicrobiales bacterium]
MVDSSPLTPAVFHVLLALNDGPLHGYGVMKRVEADSGLGMGPGTVYGSLQRLEDSGWVRVGQEDERDPRRGRLFHLTDDGRAALAREAARITRLADLDGVRALAPGRGGA